MKKVVFVGGSSYSGSTFLDLTLANAGDGFSCGEISQMFHPYKKHHFNTICGCGDAHCTLWPDVKRAGAENLYDTLFKLFPKVNHIVDSSKDPIWIHRQTKELIRAGITVENVLTWKTPEEYYQSCAKRGQAFRWEGAWVNYHKLYFRMIDSWHAVRCSGLVASTESLRMLCERIGIDYFEGKHRYWDKVHHILSGNHSAKRHLYQPGTAAYERSRKVQENSFKRIPDQQLNETSHQAIVPESPPLLSIEPFKPKNPLLLNQIVEVLQSTSVAPPEQQSADKTGQPLTKLINDLKASKVYELRRRSRRTVSSKTMRLYMQMKNR